MAGAWTEAVIVKVLIIAWMHNGLGDDSWHWHATGAASGHIDTESCHWQWSGAVGQYSAAGAS